MMETQLILDRYRPLEHLASGGFADVILAYDTHMQRRVALKRLPFPRNRFGKLQFPAGLAEARTAALLNHPSIVTVYEWDTDSDEAFIIMEYLEGASLAQVLDQRPLTLDEAATVVTAVAEALDHAHENGVLHLDLKPANVLITLDGRVKVTDFGVASLSTASGHQPTLGGTMGYMPAEQLANDRVDERTDVWAFAALVFEALSGDNPFSDDSIEGAIFKASIIEPPALSDFKRNSPPQLDDVLAQALSLHPTSRHTGVMELAADLMPHLGDSSRGRESLSQTVQELATEGDGGAIGWPTIGLWDRFAHLGGPATRGLCATVSGGVGYVGLDAMGFVSPPAAVAGAILCALGGLFIPGFGVLIGYLVFLAAVVVSGTWISGLLLALAAVMVAWMGGPRSAGLAVVLVSPLLGVAYLSPFAPLILGFTIRPWAAAVFSAHAATLTLLASAASGAPGPWLSVDPEWLADPLGQHTAIAIIERPELVLIWSIIITWAVAGAVMSVAAGKATRLSAAIGIALTAGLYSVAYTVIAPISASFGVDAAWSVAAFAPHIAASSILMMLVVIAGPPVRAEDE